MNLLILLFSDSQALRIYVTSIVPFCFIMSKIDFASVYVLIAIVK